MKRLTRPGLVDLAKMKANVLRVKFLRFFKSKKHKIVESDSLVPGDDPTVLFTPAGMNQFKKEFLGFNSGFTRAATAQRCLRTDDLDKVGKTTGHHTYFEMLGNFSFGDYFKEEAIGWAWEFLTDELKIKKERLWVSVYKEDEEAYKIWKDLIKIPQDKVIKLGDKENFWPSEAKTKGPNGPCGPCSEIFFDQGSGIGCKKPGCNPSCSCGRFIEVWNLVFTQFNRKDTGALEPLPKKNIDTGMGLERLAAVMQGAYNNFETDLFQPIVKEIVASLKSQVASQKELIYAVSDHIRAVVFAIYDGVLPSNEDRGYVVRKLIRRSILHLGALRIKTPFLYKLVPAVSAVMQEPYPDLDARKENIAEIILAEEKSFNSTLEASSSLFKEKFAGLLNKPQAEKTGIIAFQLYDTYGIPLELTKDWLDKHKIKFCQAAFDKELQGQICRSKSKSAMKGDVFSSQGMHLDIKETKFLGYKECRSKAKILKISEGGITVKKISKDEEAAVILDKTIFYPESGGQVGDTGKLIKGKNIFEVMDTKKSGEAIVHLGRVKQGNFKCSDLISAEIDTERRMNIARNHTATHLLQAALRKILGAHVQQQGSLVAPDRLRFDFTHFKDIDQAQLGRIEEVVNSYILNNYGLEKKEMSLASARKSGALAFFAEKYEGKVRVVSVGDVSRELCGGTHLDYTGQIGLFKIIQEGSVASGIRRIEAVTGSFAYEMMKSQEGLITDISRILNVPADKISQELEKRLARIKELEKQLGARKSNDLKASIDNDIKAAKVINGINFVNSLHPDMDSIRKAVDLIKEKMRNNTIIVSSTGTSIENRILWAIGVTEDLASQGIDASKLAKVIALEIGGSGGGRKDFAQGGGTKPENYNSALQKLEGMINNLR